MSIDQSGGAAGLNATTGTVPSLPLSSTPQRFPSIFANSFPPVPGLYSLAKIERVGYGDALEMRADKLELDMAGCLDAPL